MKNHRGKKSKFGAKSVHPGMMNARQKQREAALKKLVEKMKENKCQKPQY